MTGASPHVITSVHAIHSRKFKVRNTVQCLSTFSLFTIIKMYFPRHVRQTPGDTVSIPIVSCHPRLFRRICPIESMHPPSIHDSTSRHSHNIVLSLSISTPLTSRPHLIRPLSIRLISLSNFHFPVFRHHESL